MKKITYLIIILAVLSLAGCNKKDQMVSFIPTSTPVPTDGTGTDLAEGTDDSGDTASDQSGEDASADNSDDGSGNAPIVVGNTITKYVKLSAYGAVLNVRDKPSKDGKVVGTLVHTEKVDVVKIEDGWACFVMNNQYVYVSADFLVDERPDYLDPPTPTPTPEPGSDKTTVPGA
jgi:uncharacterized protein YgiM (DUF1202 family)